MEIILYIYFTINLFIAEMYFGDVSFNLFSAHFIGKIKNKIALKRYKYTL